MCVNICVFTNIYVSTRHMGFPGGSIIKNPPTCRRCGFNSGVGKIPWKRNWQHTPASLPGKIP